MKRRFEMPRTLTQGELTTELQKSLIVDSLVLLSSIGSCWWITFLLK